MYLMVSWHIEEVEYHRCRAGIDKGVNRRNHEEVIELESSVDLGRRQEGETKSQRSDHIESDRLMDHCTHLYPYYLRRRISFFRPFPEHGRMPF